MRAGVGERSFGLLSAQADCRLSKAPRPPGDNRRDVARTSNSSLREYGGYYVTTCCSRAAQQLKSQFESSSTSTQFSFICDRSLARVL